MPQPITCPACSMKLKVPAVGPDSYFACPCGQRLRVVPEKPAARNKTVLVRRKGPRTPDPVPTVCGPDDLVGTPPAVEGWGAKGPGLPEASESAPPPARRRIPWRRLAAVLACACLVTAGVYVGLGQLRRSAPALHDVLTFGGFAEEEARALAILEKDAAGATRTVWEQPKKKPKPAPAPEPKADPVRPGGDAPLGDAKPAPKPEVAGGHEEPDQPAEPKRVSRNLKVAVERWGPHHRFTRAERDRMEVHPYWHAVMKTDGFKGPPTVALRCVFRVTDDEGKSMKFDQILVLCDGGFVNGMANFNLWGDDWAAHLGDVFPLLAPR